MVGLREKFKDSAMFSGLGEPALDQLAASATTLGYDQNQLIFSQSDTANGAYLILEGSVAIEVFSSEGRAIRVATLEPGAMFGELAIFGHGERTADARALKTTSLAHLSKATIERLLDEEPAFARALIGDLVSKLQSTNTQVESITLKTIRTRLAKLLLDLHLRLAAAGADAAIKITQNELADRLLVSREKVNIDLQRLQREELIAVTRGRITITDLEGLRVLAEFG